MVWQDHPPSLKGPGKVMETRRGSQGEEESKRHSCLQEGESGDLQANRRHLDLWEGRWSKLSWKPFPNILKIRRWLGVGTMDL